MHAKIITFAAGALFALGNAVPLNNGKRDIVWVTEVETAVETVGVTTTVWVDPTGAPSAPKAHGRKGHGHRSKHQKQEQEASTSAVEVKPTPSPEPAPSSEAAPEPASYEAPSAPAVEPTTSQAPAPATTAQAEQTTSTPEAAPSTTQAPVAPVSSYEAPASSYEAPATSSAVAPSSYDSSSSSDSSSSGSSSGNPASGQSFTGELTYFTPGMGACGEMSGEGDKMVAVSESLFDQYTTGGNPNKNPLCGKTLTIKGADGADHKATIWDRCPGCAEADLDLPQEFFNEVTTKEKGGKPADGRAYNVEWSMD